MEGERFVILDSQIMGKYFGTDGIRGGYGKQLTDELAKQVGFALTKLKEKPRVC